MISLNTCLNTSINDLLKSKYVFACYKTLIDALVDTDEFLINMVLPEISEIKNQETLKMLKSILNKKTDISSQRISKILKNMISLFLAKYIFLQKKKLDGNVFEEFKRNFIYGEL